MHKSTGYYITGVAFAAACLACTLLNYRLAADITGLVAFFSSCLAVKNGGGFLAVYSFIIISSFFGYSVFPGARHYSLPAAFFFLSLVPTIRLIFFKSLGHVEYKLTEAVLYLTGVVTFVLGNIYNGADWMNWTFPGIAFAFGGFLTTLFTMGYYEVKLSIKDFFGVKTGASAPNFTLIDHEGTTVSLSEYKGKRHVLVIFVRGDWCPTCHIMLRTYEKDKAKFAEKNIVLLAIGPDPVGVNKEMVHRLGLDYKILSDDRNEAAKAYGMTFHKNNPETKFQEGIPLPAAFLIDVNGRIAYTTNPKKPGEMLRPDTIFPVIEKLQVA